MSYQLLQISSRIELGSADFNHFGLVGIYNLPQLFIPAHFY
jgi:hypothetical protein